MHTIDVLIPTYKPDRAHLTEALLSLQAQSFTNWKALIHDDRTENSETENIVKPFLTDPRIQYVRSSSRLGIGGNWNACFHQTSASIVAYLFQDDTWHAEYLESAYKILESNPRVGFVSLQHEYRGEEDMSNLALYQAVRFFRAKNIQPGLHEGRALLRYWVTQELHPNIIGEPDFVVMRREVMEKAGTFLEDMPQFLDTEYWLRLLTMTDWYNLSEKEFGIFRVHRAAASAQNELMGQGLFDRLRCFDLLKKRLPGGDRRRVTQARNHAIDIMVEKFFLRVYAGKKTSTKGGNTLMKFCMKHPFVLGFAVLRYALREIKIALRPSTPVR